MSFIAGDVGATKSVIGLFERAQGRPKLIDSKTYDSKAYESLEDIVSEFMASRSESLTSACFGVPGPVFDGECRTTNLTWTVSSEKLKSIFNIPFVTILNDLVATALAAPTLYEHEYAILNDAKAHEQGVIGVVAPGTGLGMALMVWTGSRYLPIASEGGHVDFAPTSPLQIGLLEHMMKKFERVSVERLAAGPGIAEIFSFMSSLKKHADNDKINYILSADNPSELVTRFAFEENDPLCDETLDVFVSILGSICGNLALTAMTTGGIYLGGGVSPKILPKLIDGPFMSALCNKGRFESLMQSIPVKIILNDRAALIGASIEAARH